MKIVIQYSSDGFEALDILGRYVQGVSMITADQKMPQMGGLHLLEKAQEICPHVKRVLITGYTEMKFITEGLKRGIIHQYFVTQRNDEELLGVIRKNIVPWGSGGHGADQGQKKIT